MDYGADMVFITSFCRQDGGFVGLVVGLFYVYELCGKLCNKMRCLLKYNTAGGELTSRRSQAA